MKSVELTLESGEIITVTTNVAASEPLHGGNTKFRRALFDPNLNYGDRPWERHPGTATPFTPKYVALVYITVLHTIDGPKIDILRVHFPTTPNGASNEIWDNLSQIAKWISYINTLAPTEDPKTANAPSSFDHYHGWKDLAFGQQHHVVIYIKNETVTVDEKYPVWIGTVLRGDLGISTASPNHSFYDAHLYDVGGIISGGPTKFVHLKNYFEIKESDNQYRPIKKAEKVAYSFNVNTLIASGHVGERPYSWPLDPDTGNMGEGGQPK